MLPGSYQRETTPLVNFRQRRLGTTLGVGRVFTKLRYPRSCASDWALVAQLSCLRVGRSREEVPATARAPWDRGREFVGVASAASGLLGSGVLGSCRS